VLIKLYSKSSLFLGTPHPVFSVAGENATITFTADPTTPGLYYYTIDDGE
jgi:hypothetical protein